MSYSRLLGRLVGLLVALVGLAFVTGGFFVPVAGASGLSLLLRGSVLNVVVGAGFTGLGLSAAGLAVAAGRGRSHAVSGGGIVAVAVVALLAVGTNSTQTLLGVGAVALALVLAGASLGGRRAA